MATKYMNLDDFIKSHIRFGQHWNKKIVLIEDAKWQTLTENTYLNGITYAAGSPFKVFETQDFGWVVFGPDTRTADGNIPFRRILKY